MRHRWLMLSALVMLAAWYAPPTSAARSYCGDGFCSPDAGEDCSTCAEDCVYCCGDGYCEYGEDFGSCPEDCGYCGDRFCDTYNGETQYNCEYDCGPPPPGGPCGECQVGANCGANYECISTCCLPVSTGRGGCSTNCVTSLDCCSAYAWCINYHCTDVPLP